MWNNKTRNSIAVVGAFCNAELLEIPQVDQISVMKNYHRGQTSNLSNCANLQKIAILILFRQSCLQTQFIQQCSAILPFKTSSFFLLSWWKKTSGCFLLENIFEFSTCTHLYRKYLLEQIICTLRLIPKTIHFLKLS